MNEHVSDTEIEEFALGQLPAMRLPAFEAHVSSCDRCAARLAGEARLELQLAEVHAAAPARPPRRLLPSRRTGAALGAAVLAAAVLLLVLRGGGSPAQAAGTPNVVCADGPDQGRCVERAHRHGLFVQYPPWAGPPPFGKRHWFAPTVAPSVAESRTAP